MKAVIVDWIRTPFHRAHKGKLKEFRPDDMVGILAKEIIQRNNVDSNLIDDIIIGCAYPEGEQGYNIGRITSFIGGMPNSVPGQTINRLCGSSMQSILSAVASIEVGWGDCFLCGGVESMSRIKRRGFNWSPNPNLELKFPDAYIGMVETAENVSKKWNITRVDQEVFALKSHQKSQLAQDLGYLKNELYSFNMSDIDTNKDGCIRASSSMDSMAKLLPVLKNGKTVTAATASPLTDGASIMLICSEEFSSKHNLDPIARIVAGAVTGCQPNLMGIGPIKAINHVLDRAEWSLEDVDVFEINEAFSSQSLAVIRELKINPDKVNIDGGALSIGHPLGASGARITGKAASIMKRNNQSKAIASMCIGGGMGIAIALEKL